jgi:hypothetical protein
MARSRGSLSRTNRRLNDWMGHVVGRTANQNLGKAPLPLGLDIRFVVTNLECGSPEWRPAGQAGAVPESTTRMI